MIVGETETNFPVSEVGLNVNSAINGPSTQSKSLLSSMKDRGMIPSLSFGYTAGAYYGECF